MTCNIGRIFSIEGLRVVHAADFLLKRISPSPVWGYGNAVNGMRKHIDSSMGFRDYSLFDGPGFCSGLTKIPISC